jgi:hypothetical protein
MIDQVLGWVATILFTSIYFPVIGKHYKRMLVVGLVGNIIALAYAVLISQPPLQFKYLIAIACILGFIKR